MDRLFAGEKQDVLGKRWDIHLDISAPQIFLPDSFSPAVNTGKKSHAKSEAAEMMSGNNVVVVDLGRLKLDNYSPNIVEKKTDETESERKAEGTAVTTPTPSDKDRADTEGDGEDDEEEEDDDFLTPMSTPPRTPPNLEELPEFPASPPPPANNTTNTTTTTFVSPNEGSTVMQSALTSPPSARPDDKEALTDDALRERIYDRYILQLTQVMLSSLYQINLSINRIISVVVDVGPIFGRV